MVRWILLPLIMVHSHWNRFYHNTVIKKISSSKGKYRCFRTILPFSLSLALSPRHSTTLPFAHSHSVSVTSRGIYWIEFKFFLLLRIRNKLGLIKYIESLPCKAFVCICELITILNMRRASSFLFSSIGAYENTRAVWSERAWMCEYACTSVWKCLTYRKPITECKIINPIANETKLISFPSSKGAHKIFAPYWLRGTLYDYDWYQATSNSRHYTRFLSLSHTHIRDRISIHFAHLPSFHIFLQLIIITIIIETSHGAKHPAKCL